MSTRVSFTSTVGLGSSASEVARSPKRPRAVVTGGSGKLGRATVVDLLAHGWNVVNFDKHPPPADAPSEAVFMLTELEDMGQVMENLIEVDSRYKGVDAVVHLAALPAAGMMGSSTQFRLNTMSTYNVLEASRKLGIKNIVLASSETLIGLPLDPWVPDRIPVDETADRRPESAYSLSKLVGEVMAEEYCRWDPSTKIVSLRFSNVIQPHEYAKFETWQQNPERRRWNLWGYIDARDGAQGIRKALEHKPTGHHQYIIANNNTVMRTPNDQLVAAEFPGVPYTPTLGSHDTLLSIDKAKRELGFAPAYDWQG
ncbi:hypothetical protein SERLA73DRAFT_162999 [Serpula lacrymans var. lacrymans S7.3]|uniref:NAD-dependent epimerase/dehydratase domain-containing protein n=2 Tax=Serpula lacrymans var. lacrymans TaxID=341189 RepID=F8QAZ9_SERL3|nr:uncharacterized protein SERLADRAFT_418152 [Serpula lacrymans var. lacrymans S7.9]EGN94385.1 hypothetical protein SERLA73DRAFT_162999 [Serpula lacrymans var. lacrymans S7.3]EGO19867.1 hypothetical protein SERLADRAFT_418152 [Serpula lacrymans var. lacrymans S7.9]